MKHKRLASLILLLNLVNSKTGEYKFPFEERNRNTSVRGEVYRGKCYQYASIRTRHATVLRKKQYKSQLKKKKKIKWVFWRKNEVHLEKWIMGSFFCPFCIPNSRVLNNKHIFILNTTAAKHTSCLGNARGKKMFYRKLPNKYILSIKLWI